MAFTALGALHAGDPEFNRPGTLHTSSDFDRVAALAFSGRLPWSAALHALLEEAEDSLGVEPEAPEWYTVPPRYGKGEEGARAHEREGRRLSSQSRAAYTLAVASALLSRSDKAEHLERSTVYARHGIAILNAWSHNRDMGANAEPFERKQTALVTATSGPGLLIAADILYKHPAWSGEDRDRFLAWVRDVVREASAIKTISYNNNWNTWGLYLSMLCAHLLEDADTFTADVALWRKDVFHHIIEDGRMPKELARGGGRNWYTYYALVPITTAAVLTRNTTGENLLDPQSETGIRVKAGLDYFFHNLRGHIYRSLMEATGDLYRDREFMDWNLGHRPVTGDTSHSGWMHPTLFMTWEDLPVNHPPVARVASSAERIGVDEEIMMDAGTSSDPDGDELDTLWFLPGEQGVVPFDEPLMSAGDRLYFPEALDARFEIRYTITIRKSGDMLVGLQSPDSSGSNWGDSSFQMNASNGHFRVRDGNTYRTVTEVPYEENKAYRFRVVADVAEKTYSVWVRPDDETEEILLARDFRARDGNNTFTHLNKLIYSGREGADITNIELLTLGRSLSGEKVKLSFQEPGQHEVQLTVRDAHGATDSKILSIEVK